MRPCVIGIDPGASTTGIGVLTLDGYGTPPMLLQVNTVYALNILGHLVESLKPKRIGVERWDNTRRSVRLANAKDRDTTQELIVDLQYSGWPVMLISRGASKTFATDARLKAVHPDVMRDATGMRHARDGLRIAVWTAVSGGLCPDPLSKAWKETVHA